MLVIAAAPYVARMVESSVKEVGFGVIEAAQSMGCTNMQIVTHVLLPEAKPASFRARSSRWSRSSATRPWLPR